MEEQVSTGMPLVLLMEDEPLARWVERKALEEAGAMVVEAACCADAMRLIDEQRFAAVVLDYRLPDGTGMDVARYLRSRDREEPILMLTAETEEVTPALREELDIAAAIGKPADLPALQAAIRALTGLHTQADACATDQEGTDWVDRFRLIRLRGGLSSETIATIHPTAADRGWIALDLEQVDRTDPLAGPELLDLARRCRETGGRLALMGLGREQAACLREVIGQREFDVVDSTRMLDALGRRITSYCERTSLLDSIVLTEPDREGGQS